MGSDAKTQQVDGQHQIDVAEPLRCSRTLDDLRNLFAAGLAAFLLAHVAYIGAFHVTLSSRALWFLLVAGATTPLALRIMRAVPQPPLRVAVGVYNDGDRVDGPAACGRAPVPPGNRQGDVPSTR